MTMPATPLRSSDFTPGPFPLPAWFTERLRARVLDLIFTGQKDFVAADYDVSTVGAATIALSQSTNGSVQGPMLLIGTGTTALDGSCARMNANMFTAPTTPGNIGSSFFINFDVATGLTINNLHRAIGIGSGTAAQIFDKTTGGLFSSGAGIAWRSTNSASWELVVKPSGKSQQIVATASALTTPANGSSCQRLGFMYLANAGIASSDPTNQGIGTLIGWAYNLVDLTQSANNGDDMALPLNANAYFPSSSGIVLSEALFAETAATDTRCGIFVAASLASGAAFRQLAVRRILSIDNMRR
jgi:hypothetical protein